MTVERASKFLGGASAERAEPVRCSAWLGRIGESQKTWWRAGEVPVWEHISGIRIHIHGLIRFTDGTHCVPEYDYERWMLAMRLAGWKKRRALMAYAEMLMRPNVPDETREH